MLVPIEKIEKPFQALGHAVSNIVRPQAAPQQTPAAQPPSKAAAPPSVADRVQAWQGLIGTYYTDEAIRARHMQQVEQSEKEAEATEKEAGAKIQPQLWQQELAAGELTKRQAEEKEQDRKDLRKAYQDYVDAKPADKEAARQKLIALESVISMKPMTDREELDKMRLDEQIREHNLMHQDRVGTLNERILQDQYTRQKKATTRQNKMSGVFQGALREADKAARMDAGAIPQPIAQQPGKMPMADPSYQKARQAWNEAYNAALYRRAHEEYNRIASEFPDLQLPPLGEGEASDKAAYDTMRGDLDRARVGSYMETVVPGQMTDPGADAAAAANSWYTGAP